LVSLLEPAQRFVALEDILERPPPRRVDTERLVRRDRTVDEGEPGAAAILLPQLVEDPLPLPPREHLLLDGGMIRLVRERCEHSPDCRSLESGRVPIRLKKGKQHRNDERNRWLQQ